VSKQPQLMIDQVVFGGNELIISFQRPHGLVRYQVKLLGMFTKISEPTGVLAIQILASNAAAREELRQVGAEQYKDIGLLDGLDATDCPVLQEEQ